MSVMEGAGLPVGSRGDAKGTTPSSPGRPTTRGGEREVKVTPFKRTRSRVYYASQNESSWPPAGDTIRDRTLCRDLDLRSSPGPPEGGASDVRSKANGKSVPAFRSGALWKISQTYNDPCPEEHSHCLRNAVIAETHEDASSSGEEAGEGEMSPGGSFRGSLRGSPSHRSQDSGYSDSGESTNAHNDSDGFPATPPNVKHITRVYFSDGPEQARLYNDKIVCSPELNGKLAKPSCRNSLPPGNLSLDQLKSSPTNSHATSPSRHSLPPLRLSPCNSQTTSLSSPTSSSQGSPTTRGDLDLEELAEELEYKSVIDAAARRTGAVRKRIPNTSSSTSSGASRRGQHCSNSNEKLPSDNRSDSRRPAPLRARRRWSATDMQQQQQQQQQLYQHRKHSRMNQPQHPKTLANYTNQSTSTIDLDRISHNTTRTGRLGGAWSLDALDDPVPTSRVTGHMTVSKGQPTNHASTLPRPQHTRRLRIHPAAIAKEMRNDSVSQWLQELHLLYEAECMNTLQSKSLPGTSDIVSNNNNNNSNTRGRGHTPATTRHAVRAIQRRAHAVSTEFARLCQRLEWLELDQVPSLAESLVGHIQTFLRDYTTQWTAADPDLQPQSSLGRQSKVIQQICEKLTDVCSKDHSINDHNSTDLRENGGEHTERDTTRQVVQVVTALGHAFTKLVDLMLSREIKVVVRVLEEPSVEEDVSSAVSHLTALGVDGGHICRLIARLGGVRALLGLCLEPRLRHVRVASLRALATVCCVVEGIVELEKAGGIEVVSEVLCDPECPEEERSEAAGVLAQVTSPWVENNHRLTALHTHIRPIVAALTGLAESTRSAEIFLLASAALANLTFLDGGCVEAMRAAGTARVLLRAAKGNPNISVFTKDQIATVLANLAASKDAAEEVVACGGVNILVALLKTRPAPTNRLPEVATAERIQQKSAIALSRLCGDEDVAKSVADLGGAERLVQLCKDEAERNHSDAVLVACLAALRKMASSLGSEELRGMDATELVEPRLLDSFLIYSSRQESYV